MESRHYPGKLPTTPAAAVLAGLLALAVSGCGGSPERVRPNAGRPPTTLPTAWPSVVPADPERAKAVLMRALSLVGTPYRYGGNSPEAGFDCSGLVNYVFRDAIGHSLPRRSGDIALAGSAIDLRGMAGGDLVVFGHGAVDHVGIYVGEGRFVHAPTSGGTVRMDHLDGPYWRGRILGARRLLQ